MRALLIFAAVVAATSAAKADDRQFFYAGSAVKVDGVGCFLAGDLPTSGYCDGLGKVEIEWQCYLITINGTAQPPECRPHIIPR